jgi:TRAP-type C4-dicarboxylate transport system permease small subunit
MFNVNKKLWSFNFGCLIAGSLVWLVHIGNLAPVPSVLHPHTDFILDYYPGSVTALSASIVSLLMLVFMHKGFKLCASEHTFWLLLPTLSFMTLTLLIGQFMLASIMYAAVPILIVLTFSAIVFRLKSRSQTVS